MLDNSRFFTLLLGWGMFCVLGCGQGGARHDQQQGPCAAVIPDERLPAGWRLLPTSEMPPIDKTPWWVKNPQVLEGSAARQVDVNGQPTTASRVWAVIYENDDNRIPIFCFSYSSPEQASAEYRVFTAGGTSSEELIGMPRGREDTIVIMHIPAACPDRGFFVAHFESVAKPQ